MTQITDSIQRAKIPKVNILLRKNGCPNNLVSVYCNIYDMSCYVDMLRRLLASDDFDYMIVEPDKFDESFF